MFSRAKVDIIIEKHKPGPTQYKQKAATLINFIKDCGFYNIKIADLLYLVNDGLESLGIVDCEIGENLTVNLDAGLVQRTHQC